LDGKLIIDLEGDQSVEIQPHQGHLVPKGVVHKTRAPEKTVVLMIETAGIVPTGDE
jgi:mannose-6-phosphate isomerase-like protein (cupin superfamily)